MGLDLADDGLTVVELRESASGRVTLAAIGHAPLPMGTVVAGRIEDADTVSNVLLGLMHRCRMRARTVAMGVPARDITVRRTRLRADFQELDLERHAAREANELAAGTDHELAFDCTIIGTPTDAPGDVEVQVAATHAHGIRLRQQAARAAGLNPLVVEAAPHACLRAIQHGYRIAQGAELHGTVAVVEWCGQSCSIGVFVGDELALERGTPVLSDAGATQTAKPSSIEVDAVAQGIARQLGVAAASITGGRLGGVVISGTGELQELAAHLSRVTSVPVSVVNPLAGVDVWECADLAVSFEGTAPVPAQTRALGLALRGLEP